MPAAGLMEMPPVSKHTPLPTKGDRLGSRVGRPVPAHHHQLAFTPAALAHAQQRAHAELGHLGLAQHLDLQPRHGSSWTATANSAG
jgi:hypothetical protein